VFPGNKGKPLSDGAMLNLLERMKQDQYTVHGFRSTFRDWSGEQTNFPREICELALSHVNDDETEAAYLRTDFFEKRRKLMDAWAAFAAGETASVQLIGAAD
jgi:integrase